MTIKTGGFNPQPPEGGWEKPFGPGIRARSVSTRSRPKAAGSFFFSFLLHSDSFNTQPPEGGWAISKTIWQA